MRMITCCTPDCPKRAKGCHATCPDYKRERAACDREREERLRKTLDAASIKAVQWNSQNKDRRGK